MAQAERKFPGMSFSYIAGADLSSQQFKLVMNHSTDFQCVVTTAATSVPFGRLENDPVSGAVAEVQCLVPGQILNLISDGNVTADTWVTSDADGEVTDIATTNLSFYVGFALEAEASANDFVPVLIYPGRYDIS